jgi:hypothetical protein
VQHPPVGLQLIVAVALRVHARHMRKVHDGDNTGNGKTGTNDFEPLCFRRMLFSLSCIQILVNGAGAAP